MSYTGSCNSLAEGSFAQVPVVYKQALKLVEFGTFLGINHKLEEHYSGFPVAKGIYRKAGEALITMACSDRTRGDSFKLKARRFRSDVRKFFTMRLVRSWSRQPKEVVNVPFMKTFQVRLDGKLGNLV